MIDVDALLQRLAYLIAFVSLLGFGWQAYENHRLVQTNAELARYISHTLERVEAEVSTLRKSESQLADALLVGGSVAVDSILRAEDK